MSNFINTVRPVYEKLVKLRVEISRADICSLNEALDSITQIEAAERDVLVAWAQSTRDINPTMLSEVESGQMTWYPALAEYLDRIFYA